MKVKGSFDFAYLLLNPPALNYIPNFQRKDFHFYFRETVSYLCSSFSKYKIVRIDHKMSGMKVLLLTLKVPRSSVAKPMAQDLAAVRGECVSKCSQPTEAKAKGGLKAGHRGVFLSVNHL